MSIKIKKYLFFKIRIMQNSSEIYFENSQDTLCLSPKPFYAVETIKESPSTIYNYERNLYQVSKFSIDRKNRAIKAIKINPYFS
jgi:hypothetical protein